MDLVIPNHPAAPGDELQLLRRGAECFSADCTVSARLSCERGGYRSWLRCEDRLNFTGEVDERLWVRQGRRTINRMVDLNALKDAADEIYQEVCLAMTSTTSIYALFNRQIAVWRGEFLLGDDQTGQHHNPSCYNFQGNEGDCVVQPIRDIDGDELQIIDFDLSAAQLLGQAPIQVVNADSADPKLQVRQVLPGAGHRISATFSDGLSEPQTVHIDLILRSLSGAVDCWTD